MQNFPPIGSVLNELEKRDAIHIAICPVSSAETVLPGQHVGLTPDGLVSWRMTPKIGIVDPYLSEPVKAGQRFFLFLYPKTVTSLRHEWTHPAFDAVVPVVPEPADKGKSEQWLRNFVSSGDCPNDYDTVIAAAIDAPLNRGDFTATNDGEYLTFYGMDASGEIPPEFWDHVEVVTGCKIPAHRRPTRFSCSC